MSAHHVVGEIRASRRMLKSEFTFDWNLRECLRSPSGPVVLEAPSFKTTDQFDNEHEWKLLVNVVSGGIPTIDELIIGGLPLSGPANHLKISIEYCGEAGRQNTAFAIKFKVTTINTDGSLRTVYYDDTTVQENNVRKNQNFSTKRSYELPTMLILTADSGKLHILLRVLETAPPSNVDQKVNNPHQHDISLKNEYEQLFKNGKFNDVTFVIDKQELHLHKSIPSNRSAVFAAMFDHDLKENNSNVVHIEDQSYEVMTEFFRYIYAAKVNEIQSHMIGLLITSNKYVVEGLKCLCEQELIKALKNENVLDYLNLANCHNAKSLETRCVKFIVANAKDIVELPTFDIDSVPNELKNEIVKGIARKS